MYINVPALFRSMLRAVSPQTPLTAQTPLNFATELLSASVRHFEVQHSARCHFPTASAAIPRACWHCISCFLLCADLSDEHNVCEKVAETIVDIDQTVVFKNLTRALLMEYNVWRYYLRKGSEEKARFDRNCRTSFYERPEGWTQTEDCCAM